MVLTSFLGEVREQALGHLSRVQRTITCVKDRAAVSNIKHREGGRLERGPEQLGGRARKDETRAIKRSVQPREDTATTTEVMTLDIIL